MMNTDCVTPRIPHDDSTVIGGDIKALAPFLIIYNRIIDRMREE
ncbi:MAG: hypothetical protein AAGE99_02885 [Chlamydiota bacterium]